MNATTQNLTNAGIRKAAILVACLDRAAADAVLEQLGPEQAQRVRQAVVVLDEIPDDEQQCVIDEFCQHKPLLPAREPWGLDLESPAALATARKQVSFKATKTAPGAAKEKPFVRCAKPKARNSRGFYRANVRRPSRWCFHIFRRTKPALCWRACRRISRRR